MNKIYKVVWSKAKHCYVVTSELAKRNGKGCGARSLRIAAVTLGVAAVLLGGMGIGTPTAWADGASDNTLTVTSGKGSSVYGGKAGGFSDPGEGFRGGWSSNDADDANRNTITINYATVNGRVYGGDTIDGAASNNMVTINNGTVNNRVFGGNSSSSAASNNTVTISGTVEDWVLGGYTYSGAATNNTVTISGGTVGGNVYGGMSDTGTANSNTITVTGGAIDSVHGGYSSAIANDNTVTVSGGTVGTSVDNYAVVGAGNSGSSENPVASENNVTVTGTAQVTGLVIGARDAYSSAVITDNTVTIDGSAVVTGDVIGGYGWGKDKTLNKVYVNNGTVTGNVYGGELRDDYYSSTGSATGNEVHISGGAVSGSVYGGAVKGEVSGNANSNTVEITGGEVKAAKSGDSVYGGYSDTGNADSNNVQVSGSSKVSIEVYGGVTKYTEGTANNNTVNVKDTAELADGITGGWSPNKDAKNNTITVDGGTVNGYISGGVAAGAAENNRIIVNEGGAVSYVEGGNGGNESIGNTVEVNGGKVTDTIFGGYSASGTVTDSEVTVNGGTVSTIYGGYSNDGTVTGSTITVSDAVFGAVYGGFAGGNANGNRVSITGGTAGGAIWGGYSRGGDASNNTVIVKDLAAGRAIYGGYAANLAKNATGNTVSIKNVTAPAAYHNLEGGYTDYTAEPTGDFVTGNTLIINGTNKFGGVIDNFETIKLADDFAWKNGATVLQGKFGVNYDGTRPALDITDAETALSSATSGSMTLLASSSANDFSTLSLKYSGGSATLDSAHVSEVVKSGEGASSEENGVTVTSSSTHTVSLDQANSFKNVLYSVESGVASKISLGEMAWETPRALTGFTFGSAATVDAADLTFTGKAATLLKVNDSRTLVSGATGIASLPATNITQPGTGKGTVAVEYTDANSLKFNATASGTVGVAGTDVKYTVTSVTAESVDLSDWAGTTTSTVPAGWSGAGIAVSGSFTAPDMGANSTTDIITNGTSGFFTDAGIADAIKYKEGANFTGDAANGVTLAGTQSKGVQAADEGKKLVYAAGAKDVTEITLGSMVAGTPRTMEAGYDFAGVTTIKASDLQFDKPENVKADATLLKNAFMLTAGKTVTDEAHVQDFTKTADNQVVLSASLKGTVETAVNAVNYKYEGTELTKVDLANWNGSGATFNAAGWTLAKDASNAVTATVETDGMNVSGMNPGDVKPVLSVTGVDLAGIKVNGEYGYKAGGDSIAETSHSSGVTITEGTTTGGGVKVSDSNTSQLIYEQSKKDVTAITLGSVAYTKGGTAREFGSAFDLTAVDIDASGFGLSNLDTMKAGMNACDTMVIVDAAKAVAGNDGATLKGFTAEPDPIAVAFKDEKVDGKALTFEGNHTDTLSLNEKKTQVVYKVGEKEVNQIAFTGEVEWNENEAYYTNDASQYQFNGATNVDAENLKVTGSTDKLLKADGTSSMTLLSATGMRAGTVTDQSDANKTASKVAVNYKDDKGVAFTAEAQGEVKAETGAVKYNINEVKLTDVDLSAWNGTASSVPDTWTAEDGSVKVATGSFAAPEVAAGASKNILTAGGAFFDDANISGANKYDEANGKAFSETQNNVTVSGTQAKGVTTADEGKSLVYKMGIKKADTVALGKVNWKKGAELFDGSSATAYDYANVKAVDAGKFDVTYAEGELQTIAAGDSMTLLKANETLTAIINEEKAKTYSFEPVAGVTVDGNISGTMSRSGNAVVFTAAENRADRLTFGNVAWNESEPLMTRPSNVTFAGAAVDTSNINFYNVEELEANKQMTLVSDFGESVGSITGSRYKVGTGLEGEGEASLFGSDLVFVTNTGVEKLTAQEQTHNTVMAMEAGMAMLAAGNEFVGMAVTGLGDGDNQGSDGASVYASAGGGASRYETGSHVNTNTWNAIVALGARKDMKQGALSYGVFGEYGKGSYTLHSEAGRGDGDSHYAGGGLLAKWTNRHDVYAEASFRLGRMSDNASDILHDGAGNGYGYNVHADYYGAHVGAGKAFRYDGGRSLDVYGKYFYTRRDGIAFTTGVDRYDLESVTSSVLRVGARYGTTDRKWNWYGGLAYEYEFDGESEGRVNGTAIRSASVQGSSVRGEFGMRMSATKDTPWQADIRLYGYAGKHRGFGGNVSVVYTF